MPAILYTVRATCPSVQVRGRFLSWLSPNHIVEVMKAGATSARIVLPDQIHDPVRGEPVESADRANETPPAGPEPVESAAAPAVVETQYVFPSRKVFDDYVRLHAPALRADGLKHFPPGSGVTYERQVAEIAAEL
ncbi:MAG: DUF4286 family protein [Opitutae bacterium]|nr:DUF4286 family protein [Opitutae bacterium]